MEFKLSPQGEGFIKGWENKSLRLYLDIAKVPSIGWGHTFAPHSDARVIPSVITDEQAEAYFKEDIAHVEKCLNASLENKRLSQNKVDALISFIFNVGTQAFLNSHVYAFLDLSECDEWIIEYWEKWCHARNAITHNEDVVPGLVNRRNAEVRLFRDGVYD